MSVDLNSVGAESAVHRLRYDWKTLVLYALGIGAERDELDYLYEARGPQVFPTFAVVPAYAVLGDLLARAGGDLARLVHGGQASVQHADLPPSGEIVTTGVISGIYDLKRMAQLVFRTRSSVEGQLVFETEWSMLLLGDGGFGGPRPPKSTLPKVEGQSAAFTFEQRISPEQALLYRLSGDANPLHVDPVVAKSLGFERGPILHGLATYGYCARALIKAALGGDARRLGMFEGQFRKPVWPGDVLRTVGYEASGQYVLKAFSGDADDQVAWFCAKIKAKAA